MTGPGAELSYVVRQTRWWSVRGSVQRQPAVNKMCELERACWERSEAYTQARADEAVESALRRADLSSKHVLESACSTLVTRAVSDTLVARYPWREEVCAMSAACPDPSPPSRVQSLHARGIL